MFKRIANYAVAGGLVTFLKGFPDEQAGRFPTGGIRGIATRIYALAKPHFLHL